MSAAAVVESGAKAGAMARSPSVLLLAVASFLLLLLESSLASSSHSLRYFYTAVTGPSQGLLPQFIAVGYVDDQLFDYYDSDTKQDLQKAPWMEKAGEEDPQYWDRETQVLQNVEQRFKENLATLAKYYNQSGGCKERQQSIGPYHTVAS